MNDLRDHYREAAATKARRLRNAASAKKIREQAAAQLLDAALGSQYREQLDAWYENRLAALEAERMDAIRAAFPEAAAEYDRVCAEATWSYELEVERAEDEYEQARIEREAVKAERARQKKAEKWGKGVKGAKAKAEWEKWEREKERWWEEALRTGVFPWMWTRNALEEDRRMGEPDSPGSVYAQGEEYRRKWLEIHPDHREMIESPDRTLYNEHVARVEAQRRAAQS